jgi:HK97 family phage major capsid protein
MAGVFNKLVTRTAADVLIPEEEANQILQTLPQSSLALQVCRTQRMSTKTFTQPVLGSLPAAYWVNGDTGLKQTTDVGWKPLSMTAEELATIVVIPDAVIDDSGFPLWAEIRPLLAEAIGLKLDQAVFSGIDKPATWPDGIIPAAIAAGNTNVADSTPEQGGMANDLIETMDDVEEDGYEITRFVAARQVRAQLRKSRDTSGQKLLDVSTESVDGVPISYGGFGVFDPATALAIAGDFRLAIVGVRQDITFKMLDQAVITDDTGKVIINLPQQDSQAMRVVARFGFVIANPLTRSPNPDQFPFGVLEPGAAGP